MSFESERPENISTFPYPYGYDFGRYLQLERFQLAESKKYALFEDLKIAITKEKDFNRLVHLSQLFNDTEYSFTDPELKELLALVDQKTKVFLPNLLAERMLIGDISSFTEMKKFVVMLVGNRLLLSIEDEKSFYNEVSHALIGSFAIILQRYLENDSLANITRTVKFLEMVQRTVFCLYEEEFTYQWYLDMLYQVGRVLFLKVKNLEKDSFDVDDIRYLITRATELNFFSGLTRDRLLQSLVK